MIAKRRQVSLTRDSRELTYPFVFTQQTRALSVILLKILQNSKNICISFSTSHHSKGKQISSPDLMYRSIYKSWLRKTKKNLFDVHEKINIVVTHINALSGSLWAVSTCFLYHCCRQNHLSQEQTLVCLLTTENGTFSSFERKLLQKKQTNEWITWWKIFNFDN